MTPEPAKRPPTTGILRPKVRDSELDACHDEAQAAAKARAASTPPAVKAERRSQALSKVAQFMKDLAPTPINPQPT